MEKSESGPLSTPVKVILALALIGVVALAGYMIKDFREDGTPDEAHYTMFICSETHKTFRHRNELGETLPILSPYSNKKTAYPAEACYWTADGKIKTEPTWVLLNDNLDDHRPTACPDCGRLVVGHNPQPGPGSRPPRLVRDMPAAGATAVDPSTARRTDR